MYNIHREIAEKDWNDFILSQDFATHKNLFSYVQDTKPADYDLFAITENGSIVGIIYAYIQSVKKGRFCMLSHFPLCTEKVFFDSMPTWLDEVLRFATEHKADVIRLTPRILENDSNVKKLLKSGFNFAPVHNIGASLTSVLNLEAPIEHIYDNFTSGTKYEIKRSEKSDIKITVSSSENDFEKFYKLYSKMLKVAKFIPDSKENLKKDFFSLLKSGNGKIWLIESEGNFVSCAFFVDVNDTRNYLHGASFASDRRTHMHFLMYNSIMEAQKLGLKKFDFWGGLAPNIDVKHPWSGIGKFKEGFGGSRVKFLPAVDFPLTKKYSLISLTEKFYLSKREGIIYKVLNKIQIWK